MLFKNKNKKKIEKKNFKNNKIAWCLTAEIYSVSHSRKTMSSESWSRSASSRTRYDDRKRRDRHYDDHDRYDYDDRRRRRNTRTPDRDNNHRRRGSSERDRYRSYDDDRDSGKQHRKSSSRRHRQSSRSRSRSSSYESSKHRGRKTTHHRERSVRSTEKKTEMSNIKILRASRSRSKSQNKTTDDHHLDRKNNYFDSFRTTNVDSSSIIGNIDESDFDREKIHKEMQERLSLHLAREGKVYPPPKPQASHPIFANDGSFLETFKKMQEQQHHQHVHDRKSEPAMASSVAPAVQQHYQKPMFSKRRGGKILKTGIVQKTKIADETVAEEAANDAWSLYLQEVKKYKNVSCDADSKTRPLVK